MKTLTQCVDDLKFSLELIAGRHMTQDYQGLGVNLMATNDSERARKFSESWLQEQNQGDTPPSFDNPYSHKALQGLWNVADILSIALTYAPREWSIGIVRGLMATDDNRKRYLTCLSESIDYIDARSMLPVPFIVDDDTYRMNLAIISFITAIRETTHGQALLTALRNICQTILRQPMAVDEEIMQVAQTRVELYERYQMQSDDASIPESDFYDAREGNDDDEDEDDGLKYYDAISEEAKCSYVEESFFNRVSARRHECTQEPVKHEIDWNLWLRMLSVIASVAGGAMLVVGLLLPIPGLAIAGACLLGAGLALGDSAFKAV
ncbi:MAG: hypothetical protein P1U39_04760 [Legionellaceae bacterium]|nr:hypothetical protein [Legionellaceae bacterium]